MIRDFFKRYKCVNTRQYLRLPIAWPVRCRVMGPAEERHVTATRDVSAGGIRLVMPQKVALGHRVEIEIYLPLKDRLMAVQGEVVRCEPSRGEGFELGIRFEQINSQDRLLLNQAVKRSRSPRAQILHRRAWWRKVT